MDLVLSFFKEHAEFFFIILVLTSALTLLCLVGTVVAYFTPTKRDDDFMKKIDEKWLLVLSYLPRFGLSPRHKMIEQALREALEALDDKPEGSA